MNRYSVIEKNNHDAVHCLTWSVERARHWIETMGNSGVFSDKSLASDSFCVKDTKTGEIVSHEA